MDLESWIEIQDAEHRARMGSLLEPLSPIGFSGRSGVVLWVVVCLVVVVVVVLACVVYVLLESYYYYYYLHYYYFF